MTRLRTGVRRAFSLLELTLVVLLIGILMAVVAFNMPGWILKGRITATWASMRTIKTALNAYNGYYASYPASLSQLQQGGTAALLDATNKLKDGWKNDFIYQLGGDNGHPFELRSKGPNGVPLDADDLDIWKEPSDQ